MLELRVRAYRMSQILIVPSSLPVASHLPSQWKATAVTFPVWFSRVAIWLTSKISFQM
jgi:hypothetical protein